MTVQYLIDSENVGDFWIPLLELPDEETELIVFYTKNSPHMSYESLIRLKESDKKVAFIKCYEGTNALDFQLVSELGYRICQNEEGRFVVVTNDTGYDAAVKYWRRKKRSVKRITGKECKNLDRRLREDILGSDSILRTPRTRKAVSHEEEGDGHETRLTGLNLRDVESAARPAPDEGMEEPPADAAAAEAEEAVFEAETDEAAFEEEADEAAFETDDSAFEEEETAPAAQDLEPAFLEAEDSAFEEEETGPGVQDSEPAAFQADNSLFEEKETAPAAQDKAAVEETPGSTDAGSSFSGWEDVSPQEASEETELAGPETEESKPAEISGSETEESAENPESETEESAENPGSEAEESTEALGSEAEESTETPGSETEESAENPESETEESAENPESEAEESGETELAASAFGESVAEESAAAEPEESGEAAASVPGSDESVAEETAYTGPNQTGGAEVWPEESGEAAISASGSNGPVTGEISETGTDNNGKTEAGPEDESLPVVSDAEGQMALSLTSGEVLPFFPDEIEEPGETEDSGRRSKSRRSRSRRSRTGAKKQEAEGVRNAASSESAAEEEKSDRKSGRSHRKSSDAEKTSSRKSSDAEKASSRKSLDAEKASSRKSSDAEKASSRKSRGQEPSAEDISSHAQEASSVKPTDEEIARIAACIGADNLAELHNQLATFYGDQGKDIYLSIKNGTRNLSDLHPDLRQKFSYYCEIIFAHSEEPEEVPADMAEYLLNIREKLGNLNSLRYALIKHYGKEKGRRYYFLLKPYAKAMHQM